MKKIAVVTGGASGIGLEIARKMRSAGYAAVAWDLKGGEAVEKEIDLPVVACDITSESSVAAAYAETVKRFGEPSVLVNNAGLQFMSPVDEFPVEKWNQLIGVMLTGTFLCTKAAIPAMKRAKFGRIVNISSIHGKLASPFKAAYVSAKHGVIGFSKVVALETAEHGITVNTICPGFVDTPLMRKQVKTQAELNKISEQEVIEKIMLAPQCIKKFTSTEQIADMVLFLCSDSASTITGEAYSMSGGWGMGQ
ncbi:MAG: 3-hydroxybutyrate dehydrogenase [Oligoflexia bacterium]|nr:3-hydroxybutyrate dehydrogenase [Oligoflexia bacterium]